MNGVKKPDKNLMFLLQCKNANKIMYINPKIKTYPVVIYLLKFNNENSITSCVICSKLTKKKHRDDLIDMKTLKVQSCKLYYNQYNNDWLYYNQYNNNRLNTNNKH